MEWTPIVDCVYDATISVGDESGTTITVTIQLKDYAGNNMTIASGITMYCATDAAGITYGVNDMTTDIAAATGTLAVTLTAGVYQLVSTATGSIVLTCTDSSDSTACYLVLVMPNGKLVVSGAVTFAG